MWRKQFKCKNETGNYQDKSIKYPFIFLPEEKKKAKLLLKDSSNNIPNL